MDHRIVRARVKDTITERAMDGLEQICKGPIIAQSDDGCGTMFLYVKPTARPTEQEIRSISEILNGFGIGHSWIPDFDENATR